MTEPNAVSNDDGRKLIPKLRFPGFEAGWLNEPLSKVLDEHKLKNDGGCEVFSVSLERGVVNQIEHLGRSFAAQDTSKYNRAKPYDIVYTKSPLRDFPYGIVKQCKVDTDVALSPLYGVFSPTNRHLGLLIEAYFESPNRSKAFLAPLCQKGAKNTIQISNSTFLSGRLPLPREKAEQQEIAECLSTLDDLIGAESQKLDALNAHKRGLVQQLLPRQGETIPRLRFPEFADAAEWKEKPLEAVADYENGKAYEPHITQTGKYVVVNSRFISTDGAIRKYSNESLCIAKRGDVMMVLSDLPKGRALAKCYYADVDNLYAVNQRVCRLESHGIHSKFLHYLINRHRWLLAYDDGMNQTHLSKDSVLQCPLNIPPTLEEQRKVADLMTFLDDLIGAQIDKLDALTTHKKGLLQQLFPSPVEAEA